MIFSIAFYQGETIVANKQEEHITYSRRQADEVKSANSRPTKAKARTSYSIAVASNHRFYIFLFSLVMG